jgi:hypothetical protein
VSIRAHWRLAFICVNLRPSAVEVFDWRQFAVVIENFDAARHCALGLIAFIDGPSLGDAWLASLILTPNNKQP